MSLPADGTCRKLRELGAGRHFRLFADEACRLFVAQRTPLLFANAEEIALSFAEIERAFLSLKSSDYVLLLDLRLGPARNDPAFERISAEHRGRVLDYFVRHAALVSTAVGLLQVQRYARIDDRGTFSTASEAAAFEHLGLRLHTLSVA